MFVQPCCQRAYFRCHPIRSTKKKKGAKLQKATVSHGKTKMVRRRELPCVRRSMSMYRGRVFRGAVSMLTEWKKKWRRDKEGAKKRIDGKKDPLFLKAEFECLSVNDEGYFSGGAMVFQTHYSLHDWPSNGRMSVLLFYYYVRTTKIYV
jgi:hypothetical protein